MARTACTSVATCELFAHLTLRASLGLWKCFYCEGEYERCERRRLAELGMPVPGNMLPNGKLLKALEFEQAEAGPLPGRGLPR